ncbi:MAG: hypothetical protein IJ494_04155 [Bacteroides sp.]|nr:hypothetical protein [Bacteroides sp.]
MSEKNVIATPYRHSVTGIQGMTYSELQSTLSTATIQALGRNTETVSEELESIAQKLADKEILLTVYDYIPLVGMNRMKTPGQDSLSYHYDKAGRLLKVKDYEGNQQMQYEYRYQNGVVIEEDD